MKKFFMFAAMASVALVSCVKNEPAMPVAQQDEISFELPLVAPAVKAVDEMYEGNFTSPFKVWGYFSATEMGTFTNSTLYMDGVEISYQDVAGTDPLRKAWKSTTGKYYWPNNGYLTFVGYAPATATGAYAVGANGLNITDYTVAAAANVDLLVSQISYNNTKPSVDAADDNDTPAYADGAEIVFEHALSSIQFTMKTTSDIVSNGYELKVKKISIIGADSKGNFAQTLTGDPKKQMETATAANDGWTPQNVTTTYVAYTDETGILLTDAAKYTNGNAAQTENKTDLILLPQVLTGKDVKLEVVYTLANETMTTPAEQTTTVNLAASTVEQWLRGKRYTYNLTVKLDEIEFDPEVSAWVAGAAQDNDVTPDYN